MDSGGTCPSSRTPGRPYGGELYPPLEAARNGDSTGLADFCRRARELLLRVIVPRLRGGWPEAFTEDVVQEALVDIVRSHADCRATSEGETVAWVVAIGRRRVASLYRQEALRRKKRTPLTDIGDVPDTKAAVPSPGLASLLTELDHAVSGLSAEHHHLLWERLLARSTWAEVGSELDIPRTAAKRRWQRLMVRLKRTLRTPAN